MNTEFGKCDKYRHTLIHTLQITCLEIQFKNEILPSDCTTSKAFEVKTVQFSELLDWQPTRTVKMEKKVGMMKIQDSLQRTLHMQQTPNPLAQMPPLEPPRSKHCSEV